MNNRNNIKTENCLEMENIDYSNCIPQEKEIRDVRLAHAYVPFQKYCYTYMPLESLKKGTTFPELYSPYIKRDCYYEYEKKH